MSGKALERRTFETNLECRASTAQGDGWTLVGHSAVWGVPYKVGHFTERVEAGAARRSLKNNPDITLLLNHGDGGSGLPLARTKNNTMTVAEDSHGLLVTARLDPEDSDSQTLKRKLDRGDLDGQMSIAFLCVTDEWDSSYENRLLKQIELHRGDCSIVTQAASPTTSAEMRQRVAEGRCETCGGSRAVSCPNCNPDGTYPAPIVSVTSNSRSLLDELPSMRSYRERAGIGSPAEITARRLVNEEKRRKEKAELDRRGEMLSDWKADLERSADVRRKREALYRGWR
jgi:HK97 family phage prohead protease